MMGRALQTALLLAALAVSAGCTTTSAIESGPPPTAHRASSVDHAGPYVLDTHCGILDLQFEGRWYARAGGLLDDGQGGAPPGWDDPEQAGALVVEGSRAYFSDGARGHFETFELRPGATAPMRRCS